MHEKLAALKSSLLVHGRVIVAFSGGTDSAFLMKIAADTLGTNGVLAVTGASETYTPSELEFAKAMASGMGVRHVVMETNELADDAFTSNTAMRCYHCKGEFYAKVRELARAENIDVILDGTNADDTGDYRPGRIAVREHGVVSPLLDAGFMKAEIRALSKEMGLPSWNRPANPCLASRIPYGSRITREKLEAVARAEAFLRERGFGEVRVRHHDAVARIEIPLCDMNRFLEGEVRGEAARRLKEIGFTWVALDIEGYTMGSLNRAVRPKE
jgi:pyridinium-3,5-biscarboxylic acid mononucleotide sulfurtransferase